MTIDILQFYLFILTPILFVIGIWCYYDFKKFKLKESEKLSVLFLNLEAEKKRKLFLETKSESILNTRNDINKKLLKIKIDIFILNFSLHEIFN
ncbi:hypothetical protein [Polaribacter marinivivus]|uniref:Uncharacterized protein n=1 Tax=Polaribacter marinivivus TaxID=1524260 RepID=A0ABV8R4H6_9FLAO